MVEQPEEWEQWSAPYLEVETGRSHEGIEELEGQPLPDSQAELIGPMLAVRGPANLDPCEYA